MLINHPLTDDDLLEVLSNLTPEDDRKIKASGIDPIQSFTKGKNEALMCGAFRTETGVAVCIWGLCQDQNDIQTGIPWIVATPEIRKHPREVVRQSILISSLMKSRFTTLHNLVHKDHDFAQRWAKWMGFTIFPELIGPGQEFHYCKWSAQNVRT